MPKCVACGKYTRYQGGRCSSCYKKAKSKTFTTSTSRYPRDKKTKQFKHHESFIKKTGTKPKKGYEIHHRDGNVNNWRKDNLVSVPKGLHKKITKHEKGMSPEERKKNSGKLLKRIGKKIWGR